MSCAYAEIALISFYEDQQVPMWGSIGNRFLGSRRNCRACGWLRLRSEPSAAESGAWTRSC